MAGEGYAQEKVFHAQLANAAVAEFGPRCPCCGNAMYRGRVRKKNPTAQNRRDRASVAHYRAVAFGGDRRAWVWACRGCNNDQGEVSMTDWGAVLERQGDVRAARVQALAIFMVEWCRKNGIALYGRRSAQGWNA